MRRVIFALGIQFVFACSKTEAPAVVPPSPINPVIITPTNIVYPINTLDSFSVIYKTTSWYNTTRAMTQLFDVLF